MEEQMERKWNKAWYALPVAAVAIPAIIGMRRRSAMMAEEQENKDWLLLQQSNINLTQAMNTALKYIPGTPIEVELEEKDGMPVWEVEVVPKNGGPTRDVRIDACTGDLLEMKAEA